MSGTGQCWPEQEAIDEWWRKHSMELKKAVTQYRIDVQNQSDNQDTAGDCQGDLITIDRSVLDEKDRRIAELENMQGLTTEGEG